MSSRGGFGPAAWVGWGDINTAKSANMTRIRKKVCDGFMAAYAAVLGIFSNASTGDLFHYSVIPRRSYRNLPFRGLKLIRGKHFSQSYSCGTLSSRSNSPRIQGEFESIFPGLRAFSDPKLPVTLFADVDSGPVISLPDGTGQILQAQSHSNKKMCSLWMNRAKYEAMRKSRIVVTMADNLFGKRWFSPTRYLNRSHRDARFFSGRAVIFCLTG